MFLESRCDTRARLPTCKNIEGPRVKALSFYHIKLSSCFVNLNITSLSLSSLLSFFAATNYNLKGERRKKKHKLPEKAKIKHQQQMISKSCSRLSPPNFLSFPLIN
jgi:hypothetical protein